MSKNIAEKIYNHPDREEIIAKSIAGVSAQDISEAICARYASVSERKFNLSTRQVKVFQNDYLDFYTQIKNDLALVKEQQISPESALTNAIDNNSAYRSALLKYTNNELDIKAMVQRLCAAIEVRTEQVFKNIMEDPENMRFDRILVEYANTLSQTLKDCNEIVNGSALEQVNIQNNVNIQILDTHINTIYDIIKEILSKLDYETSIMFIEMFNDRMGKLKEAEIKIIQTPEARSTEAKLLVESAENKLNKF